MGRRRQLVEIEDQAWFPAFLRDYATDYLHAVQKRLGLPARMAPIIRGALVASGQRQVVDLCSGGSGPIVEIVELLARDGFEVDVALTDKFPNLGAFERAENDSSRVRFVATPVDAAAVPRELRGLRTLFNGFHHFDPEQAAAVLGDAVGNGQPIALLELSHRSLRGLIAVLAAPVLALLLTPFFRPFRWGRLFWTYLVPVVPGVVLWDGVVSQLRSYTPAELDEIARRAGSGDYTWQSGEVPMLGTAITYLIGVPADPSPPEKVAIAER